MERDPHPSDLDQPDATDDDGFRERPSAPAQLLPGMVGSVARSVRLTTFVRERELRNLTFKVDEDCAVGLPLSPDAKHPGSLSDIFHDLRCPVVHLGYLCGHRQRWENLGTHLGEVVHSVALAPGESRNIALVNWHRRQLTALEEHTTTSEQLTATFVQNRALEEITTAVAREHQGGRTQTEASTSVTAGSFVAAGAVVGAVAGGVIGTIVEPIGGTLIGAAVGGGAGAVAGGLVYSGSQALGMIEAETDGDREILADVQQRISLSTSQTASAVRSLWSTVVVEDAQAEGVEATTSNITNYNHMHSLNLEYYEVLQRYQVALEAERIQPLLFLPFTFFDLTSFRFVRDYWEAVRPHVGDEALQAQGDSYFVTEAEPEAPDLLPVPEEPEPPAGAEELALKGLIIDVLFDSLPANTNVNLSLLAGSREVPGAEVENGVPSHRLDGYDWGNRYTFPDVPRAREVSGVTLSRDQAFDGDMPYRVRVVGGRLFTGERRRQNLAGEVIESNGTIRGDAPTTRTIGWRPAADFESGDAAAQEAYDAARRERLRAMARNAARQAAYEALVDNIARFELRLQKLILRRRHFFTRVILDAIEPEEIIQLLESLTIAHEDAGGSRIPLSAIAHTIPLGMTPGAFVLKLRRLDEQGAEALFDGRGLDDVKEELEALVGYGDAALAAFDDAKASGALDREDEVHVPTGGLFLEAILGRSNSAEYLDLERYFHWQDSPIPHQPPPIEPVGTGSRFQQGSTEVHLPTGDLQVINPVSLPDPAGLTGILAAIQNGGLFRDMSKSGDLTGIVGSLSALAGQMGQAAATMTGQAAQDALKAATEVGQAAAALAQSQAGGGSPDGGGGAPSTMTQQGAALNAARDREQAGAARAPNPPPGPPAAPAPAPAPSAPAPAASTTSEEIVRKAAGLPPRAAAPRPARDVHVRLTFESVRGKAAPYAALAGLPKLFRLFHETDVRDQVLGASEELVNPIYLFTLPRWSAPNGILSVQLDFEGKSFADTVRVTIPAGVTVMEVRAKLASTEKTIVRSSTTSESQAHAEAIAGKLGVTVGVGKKIAEIVNLGATGEVSGSETDTDTDATSDTETVSEVVLMPTGDLDVSVEFKT